MAPSPRLDQLTASQRSEDISPLTHAQLLASFPPPPVAPLWPATEASSEVLARVLSTPFALDNPVSQ